MPTKTNPWNNFFCGSITPGMDRVERARVLMLNQLTTVGAVVAVLVGIKDILLKELELTVIIPVILFFLLVLAASRRGYHLTARFLVNLVLPLLMTVVLLLYGHDIGTGYTLFVFITTAVIFHKTQLTRILLILYTTTLFTASSLYLITYTPPLAHRIDPLDLIITFIGTSVSVALMITYFLRENLKYEKEQQKLMHSLQRVNQSLRQANEEIERFAYIASHDLKTPLRTITSFIGLIERDLKKGRMDHIPEYLEFTQSGARHINALVEDILDFSKLSHQQPLELQRVDVYELVSNCAEQLRYAFPRPFRMHIERPLPAIQSSSKLLGTLVMNLLENGIKYNDNQEPLLSVSATETEHHYELLFKDNGIGIPEEFHSRVFEMFQRLHAPDQYSGTGIGLAICEKIASRLSGSIHLQSQPGAGSCFTVVLPKVYEAETDAVSAQG